MSKNKYKSSFQYDWLSNEFYKNWVKKVDDEHKACCKVCMRSFSMLGLDVKTLNIHTKRKNHLLQCPTSNQQKLKFQANEKDDAIDRSENKFQSASSAMKQTTAQSFFIKQETIKAEIMWTLEVIMSNYSYRSCASKSVLLSVMFQGSN